MPSSKGKSKTKVTPKKSPKTNVKDTPDKIEEKKGCCKKIIESIVTPKDCFTRLCEDVKGASGPIAKVQIILEILFVRHWR